MKKIVSVMLCLTVFIIVALSIFSAIRYQNEHKFITNISQYVTRNSRQDLKSVDSAEVGHYLYELLYTNGATFSTIDGSLVWNATEPFSDSYPKTYFIVEFIAPISINANDYAGERNVINNISAVFINPEDGIIYFARNEVADDVSKIYFSHGIKLDGETAERVLNQLYHYAENL